VDAPRLRFVIGSTVLRPARSTNADRLATREALEGRLECGARRTDEKRHGRILALRIVR
jgi:hypothetical protein